VNAFRHLRGKEGRKLKVPTPPTHPLEMGRDGGEKKKRVPAGGDKKRKWGWNLRDRYVQELERGGKVGRCKKKKGGGRV